MKVKEKKKFFMIQKCISLQFMQLGKNDYTKVLLAAWTGL